MVATLLVGLCIVSVVGYSFTVAETAWVLLGLLFLGHLRRVDVYETTCPKCDNVFKAVRNGADKTNQFLKEITWESALIAVAICIAVGVAVFYFKTAWALLGLLFLGAIMKSPLISTTCPKCNYAFTATKNPNKDELDDDDDLED